MTPLHLRIFVSSPGDVARERELLADLLARLPRDPLLADRVTLSVVAWDDPEAPAPMVAGETPQSAINRYKGLPADCDLTVVILRGRIGTPLAADIRRADGSCYESGTVWEFENALAGRQLHPEHEVLVYRCTRDPEVSLRDPKFDEKRAQLAALDTFCERVKKNADGSYCGGINKYDTPEAFVDAFRKHFNAYLRGRLPEMPAAPPPAKPWLVREALRSHRIVGRDKLVDEVWRRVCAGRNTSLLFLPGVGKTTVAQELVRDRDKVLAAFDGVLWANLGRQHVDNEELRRWAEALGISSERMNSLDRPELWTQALREAIGERRLLVVLDDVWRTEDAQRFMALGPHCVFVSTTRSKAVAIELGDREVVAELPRSQGFRLLREIAPEAVRFDPFGAKALVGAMQGLPLALVLVGKLLRRAAADDPPDPDRLRRAYHDAAEAGRRLDLCGDDRRSLGDVIELSFAALHTDAARDAAIALSIFRPKPNGFCKDIALAVCDADEDMLWDISDMGLIGHYLRGNSSEYTMHRIVAEYARTRLPLTASQALHRKALAFYADKLRGTLESDPEAYLGWYRYEQAEWQETKDACLYHMAHAGDTAAGVLAFLRVFFDAFWWWGYYQRFPFCERLIAEWRQRELEPRAREILNEVARFQDAYPAGPDKRAAAGDWARVEKALLTIRDRLGLVGEIRRIEGEDARRVRAFIDFFLAEAWAYGRGDRDEALRHYEAARTLLVADGMAWIAAWIAFYVAQYLFELGDLTAAREQAQQSLAEGSAEFGEAAPLEQRDSELLANDYRLLGDLALAAGDSETAARAYCRAALYAYIFQAIPEPADSYTMAFYREITGRVAGQLAALLATDPARGRAFARMLADFGAPCRGSPGGPDDTAALDAALESGVPARLAAALFPAGLDEADIVPAAAAYGEKVLAVLPAYEEATWGSGWLAAARAGRTADAAGAGVSPT
ncbi:tetratricopeptide repeat protein [Azoarcus sp. DD4]|uniref:tetratricopeptide repeat protein n=1 Tax=Azoarcus sp. DD4 TaxID=2027405 RepID=UPI001F0F913A|nr:tetratricopeptide repeat protein [Azoarcus sp. DD4]